MSSETHTTSEPKLEQDERQIARREKKLDLNGYRCANGHLRNTMFAIARIVSALVCAF